MMLLPLLEVGRAGRAGPGSVLWGVGLLVNVRSLLADPTLPALHFAAITYSTLMTLAWMVCYCQHWVPEHCCILIL
jgi:hypothetical protein